MDLASHTFTVVRGLSVLTVVGQIIAVLLLLIFFTRDSWLHRRVVRSGLWLMLLVALVATVGSLFFSEIAGWTPCKDCWLQRIVMYPQVVLLAVALWRRDRNVGWYILPLCLIGIVIATGHYMQQVQAAMQVVTDPLTGAPKPCDATGVSCATTQIKFTFGYITIPMMALTAFILNALGSVFLLRSK